MCVEAKTQKKERGKERGRRNQKNQILLFLDIGIWKKCICVTAVGFFVRQCVGAKKKYSGLGMLAHCKRIGNNLFKKYSQVYKNGGTIVQLKFWAQF